MTKSNQTFEHCIAGWNEWGEWPAPAIFSPAKIKHTDVMVILSASGKTATIKITEKDGEITTVKKRVSTNGFFFRKMN